MKKYNFSKPLCLIILDGWGLNTIKEGNAIKLAKTPNMDDFYRKFPYTALFSSGESVGLPDGQMGNSEVGHLNIGAGRIVYQELTRISKSIRDGDFFKNEVLLSAIENARKNDSCLHLMGLVSDGGVHSHISHLKALIDMALKNDVRKLYIHAFLDGRDVPPRSAVPFLQEVDKYLKIKGAGEIATVSGRYYSMDRDNRWDRVKKAYDVLVYRYGSIYGSAEELVEKSYNDNIDDEFVVPALVKVKDEQGAKIKTSDSVIFFNFRPDRARQLTRSFISENFSEFDRGTRPPEVYFACLTRYNKEFSAPVAFPPAEVKNTIGEIISKNNLKQLRIAETEKYAHVTFFFNGGVEKAYPGEDRVLIPSPKVATYDLKPEMSAVEVTDKVIELIDRNYYDLIIMNYANPDMVGHTGFLDAAIKAVETVDACLGRVVEKVREKRGFCIITADHGNSEEMMDCRTKCVVTAHSTFKVPFIICSNEIGSLKGENLLKQDPDNVCNYSLGTDSFGALCDISPTILQLLGIEKPSEMTGTSLILD
jgi:2,3-bisphosphoglycerate-independent phosphoglycerate mutase